MVGVSPEDEAILIMATAEHGDEVRRNPYHLRHSGRMIENVRLGRRWSAARVDRPRIFLSRSFTIGRSWRAKIWSRHAPADAC